LGVPFSPRAPTCEGRRGGGSPRQQVLDEHARSGSQGPRQRVDRWAGAAPDDGRWLTRGLSTLLGDTTGKHRDGARPAITGRWRKDTRLLVERGRSAGPTGADHGRTRRGRIETVSHELTEPNAKAISRTGQIGRMLRPCYPLPAWLPPRGSGGCFLAHLSTSTRCQTGPAASLAKGPGKSGRLTYLAAERSGTFKNLTISAKPSRSPGRTGDEPRTSQDTWRHCCHEARSRGTLPLTSTLPLV
jgi:hypothetical protein